MKLLRIILILSVLASINSYAQSTKPLDKEDFIVTAENEIQIPKPEIDKTPPQENTVTKLKKSAHEKKSVTLNKKSKVNTANKKNQKPPKVYRGIL